MQVNFFKADELEKESGLYFKKSLGKYSNFQKTPLEKLRLSRKSPLEKLQLSSKSPLKK